MLKKLLPKVGPGSFLHQVSILAGSTAVAQALVALISPILTRIYTPEDFGILAVFTAVVAVFNVVAALRYELAIPLPKSDGTASNILGLCVILIFVSTVAISAGVFLFGDVLAHAANVPEIRPFLWLIPIGVFSAGMYNVFSYWAIRREEFGAIGRTKITRGAGLASVQLALGLWVQGPLGLLAGDTVGYGAGSGTLAKQTFIKEKELLSRITVRRMAVIARRYIRFPLFSSWSGGLNALSTQLPMVLLAFYFGPAVTGAYALGYRILYTPLSLVGQSIAQVFLSRAAEATRSGTIADTTWSVFSRLVDVGVPAALVIAIAAPELFVVLFGSTWNLAGTFSQLIAPWLFFVLVASPLSTLPSVFELQGKELVFQATLLAGRIGAIVVGGVVLKDAVLTIALFGGVGAACWAGFMFWNMAQSGVRMRRVFTYIGGRVAVAAPITVPLFVACYLDGAPLHIFILAILTTAVLVWQVLRRPSWKQLFAS